MKQDIVCCAAVLLVALALVGCAASSTQGPMAWLDEPLDGAALPLEPTEIMAHASDADGVSSLEFYVNGALLVRSPVEGGMLANATAGWDPDRAGVYTIAARATDSQGNVGPYAEAEVTVGTVQASPTPRPTGQPTEEVVTPATPTPRPPSSPAPTGTPRPPTPTPPFPTATPRPPTPTPPVPTPTPRPPTATPQPPAQRAQIAYFEANPGTINAGQCSTIRWGVDYASAVYLDGEGVFDHEERQVCPATTTTYTLYATSGGGDDTAQVTVNVTQPQPTETQPFSADLAITDLRAEPPSLVVIGDLTNHGPGTVSNVTVQLSCQWDEYDTIENAHHPGQMGPMPILIGSLSPGQTQQFNTDISVQPGQYDVDFSCSIEVPFSDPNLGNNTHSEEGW